MQIPEDDVCSGVGVAHLQDEPLPPWHRKLGNQQIVRKDGRSIRPADLRFFQVGPLTALHRRTQKEADVASERETTPVVLVGELPNGPRKNVQVDKQDPTNAR